MKQFVMKTLQQLRFQNVTVYRNDNIIMSQHCPLITGPFGQKCLIESSKPRFTHTNSQKMHIKYYQLPLIHIKEHF